MSFWELVLIALSLAMDAFTVSMMYGMTIHHMGHIRRFSIAFYFGLFQSLMPVGGYYLGSIFSGYIRKIDHYIAFIFLLVIGFSMLRDAFNDEDVSGSLHWLDLTMLALATSIDAFAIGMTFAFLNVRLSLASLLIGGVTFGLCFLALYIGGYLGEKFQRPAYFGGGIVLMIMAIRILSEHLG